MQSKPTNILAWLSISESKENLYLLQNGLESEGGGVAIKKLQLQLENILTLVSRKSS